MRDKYSGALKSEPFNGQLYRREIIDELISRISFKGAIETGTGLGTSTEYLYRAANIPVYSCELNPKRFGYCQMRFKGCPEVRLFNTDSALFLQRLQSKDTVPRNGVLFYLDAHWGSRLPLSDEVGLVATNWSDSVVVIDDFKVPADEDYGFDTYGAQTLDLQYISPLDRFYQVAFPARPGNQESGARRGAVILSTRGEDPVDLSSLETLKLYR